MKNGELEMQVVSWATKAGASAARAQEYGVRAAKAYDQIMMLAPLFANHFNRGEELQIIIDNDAVAGLVLGYNREILNFKLTHNVSVDDRIDTHICAGLWFCCIAQNPIFGCDEDMGVRWDTASSDQLAMYNSLLGRFAFYFAFRVLRGHYKKYEENYLLLALAPIRKYMVDHLEAISSSHTASVGIFLTISVFDQNCPETTQTLS